MPIKRPGEFDSAYLSSWNIIHCDYYYSACECEEVNNLFFFPDIKFLKKRIQLWIYLFIYTFSLMLRVFGAGRKKRHFFHFAVSIRPAGGLGESALLHTMKLEAQELLLTSVGLCDTGTYSGNPSLSFISHSRPLVKMPMSALSEGLPYLCS